MTAPESPAAETPAEPPAELLRRAAAKVRERGEAARARGPYSVEGRCVCDDDEDWTAWCSDRTNHRHSSWQVRTEVPHDPTIISYQVAVVDDEHDAAWIALASPALAEPLAAWLDQVADSAAHHVPIWRRKRPDGWDGEIGDPWIDRDPDEHVALVRGHYGHALDVAAALLGEEATS